MIKNKFLTALLLVSLLSLTFTACGPKNTVLDVEMTDYKFTPNTFSVPANGSVTINLTNGGTIQHEFVIMKLNTSATIPFNEDDEGNIYWQAKVDPGKSGTFAFTAPSERGTYEVVCRTAGHLEQGMKATLTVTK